MVTAGTYLKQPYLNSPERLDFFLEALFKVASEFQWQLRAWAVLSNHYHLVGESPAEAATLRRFMAKLHMTTAKALNEWDQQPGRKVWYQFWESRITFQRSYHARLKYVHFNPAHHGVAQNAENYRWCSASWFKRSATPAFVKTIESYKIDQLNVPDDF